MSTPALNIFLSHKHEDKAVAQVIAEVLTAFSGGKIKVFMSIDIPFGEKWLEEILDKLSASKLLLLLFTDNKASWDWCLYEAGMFTRLEGDVHNRVICLHSPDIEEPPSPLRHLQAIKGDAPTIERFLKDLYKGTIYVPEPIAPELQDSRIRESAEKIVAHMTKTPRESHQLLKQIWIKVRDVNNITPDKIPSDAEVLADQASLELFDKKAGTFNWSELEKQTKKTDQRWIKQLAKAMYQASRKTITDRVCATFAVRDSSKLYQPILNSVEWERDGSIKFQVLFHDEVTWRLPDIPEELAVLYTAQSMALRFRYEVLSKYVRKLRQNKMHSLPDILSEIQDVISSIEQEADSRGLLEESKLLKLFKPDQREQIQQMYDDWYDIRRVLEDAFQQSDADTVKRCLARLEKINSQFIPMAAQRYEALTVETLNREGTLYTFVKFSHLSPLRQPEVNTPPLSEAKLATESSRGKKRGKEPDVSG